VHDGHRILLRDVAPREDDGVLGRQRRRGRLAFELPLKQGDSAVDSLDDEALLDEP
jgi:hypothetical protein